MFYAHFVLAKKGPLARIWLAAHWDKKLTKAHVFEINIESSVEGILQPKVKMALRTSGHLLLGIVRIYSRKAKYLLADCNEAFIKIKMAFRPGMVDLPEGNREAAVATITLPEVFHDFDSAMPDITIDMDAEAALNQSRAEDITIKEDYGTLSLMTDDGFDDMAFDDIDVVRDATNIDDGFDQSGLMFPKERPDDILQNAGSVVNKQNVGLPNLKDTDFPAEVAEGGLLDNDASGIFETGGLFDDPLSQVPMDTNTDQGENQPPVDKPAVPQEDSDDDMYDMGPASMGAPSPPSSPESPVQQTADKNVVEANIVSEGPCNPLAADLNDIAASAVAPCSNSANEAHSAVPEMPPPPIPPQLSHNEEESFALAPLDATIVQGAERTVKAKRKRKLIVDEVKNISGEEMKCQLSDTTDIVTSLDLAPPTKCLMHWKETGGVEKLFALPGHPILSKTLSKMYQRHLTTRSVENEDFGFEDDKIVLDAAEFLEQVRDEDSIARKRRREMEPLMPQDLNHIDPMHLDNTRSSYSNEHGISHHPLDVSPNFLPPHMFHNVQEHSQSQIMSPIMPPPAHMLHQMLPPDSMNSLPHGSQMMHSPAVGIDPVSQLSSMPEGIHEMPPPGVVDFTQTVHPAVIESVSQHLMSNSMTSIVDNASTQVQQPVTDKQLSQSPVLDQTHIEPLNSSSLDIIAADKDAQNCMNEEMLVNGDVNNVPQEFPDGELNLDKHEVAATDVGQSIIHTEKDRLNDQVQIPSVPFPSTSDIIADDVLHSSKELDAPQEANNLTSEQRPFPEESDDDDYGAPSSVGPIYPEEQMADETYEQFEERILTKRTTHMLHIIHHQLDNDREVKFSELTRNHKRKQVAQKFYTFLVLKKQQAVELQQTQPYGDLTITKGPKFSAVYNAN